MCFDSMIIQWSVAVGKTH